MNTRQLEQLEALRALREQRAARQWAAQRTVRATASAAMESARQALAGHEGAETEQAEELAARLSSRLPVSTWQQAHARLAAMAEQGQALLAQYQYRGEHLRQRQVEEAALRQAWLGQQRQLEAGARLLAERHRAEALIQAQREEDELPRSFGVQP